MFVHEVAECYRAENTPVIVIAGRDYGTGSARDFAAKGPLLLGVRAVIAESFAPTHRWNLVGMGIVPLLFAAGEGCAALGLSGEESYTIEGWGSTLKPGAPCAVLADHPDGRTTRFTVMPQIETEMEMAYLAHGGILPMMVARAVAGTGL
jgi:aconitate hydratase